MVSRYRTVLALAAAVSIVALAAAVIWLIRASKSPADTATLWGAYLGTAGVAVPLLLAVGSWMTKRREAVRASTGSQLAAAANGLASATMARWRQEAAARRIITPAPVMVRWRWAADDVGVPPSDVAAPAVPGAGPPPMPAPEPAAELLRSGLVARLHDEVYARLPYGRLVLIGGPGTGKTGAMILLLLAAGQHRDSLPAAQRERVPVPVWLTLGGWDPLSQSLRDWASDTMNRDFPALRAAEYGSNAAAELVRTGHVALFLDGLDEMPEGVRELALDRVSDETRGLRVVVTSRPEEYRHAVGTSPPEHTAVIELRPVRPRWAAEYLLHDQVGRSRERWEQVGEYLMAHPDSVAARALDNPLNLSLARDSYAGRDPAVLADPARFATVETMAEHLIDQFLVTAYPEEQERERAIAWLRWLARNMGSSADLQWWDIPGWLPRWKLRLGRAVAACLVTWAAAATAAAVTPALPAKAAFVLLMGLGAGVIAGLVARVSMTPARRPRAGQDRAARSSRWRRLVLGLGLGLALLWVIGFAGTLASGLVAASGGDGPAAVAAGEVSVCVAILVAWYLRGGRRTAVPLLERWYARALIGGLAAGLALGLWVWSAGQAAVTNGPAVATTIGPYVALVIALGSRRGFGLSGVPQRIVPRRPRGRRLFFWAALGAGLFVPLIPVLLNDWAAPAASSPSATAAGTYRADRRTSMLYALVYAVALGLFAGLLSGLTGGLAAGIGWAIAVGFATWVMAWLVAGQVPLLKLAEFVLAGWRPPRVRIAQLLEDARRRQVMRQAGAVYQFRHAALQKRLVELAPAQRRPVAPPAGRAALRPVVTPEKAGA
jgi:hypothetical protein